MHISTNPIPPRPKKIAKTYDVMLCAGGSGATVKYWHDVTGLCYDQGRASFTCKEKQVIISGDYIIEEN